MAQTRAQKAAAAAKRAKAAQSAAPPTEAAGAPPAAPTIKEKKIGGENQSVAYIASKIPRGLYLDIHNFHEQLIPLKGAGGTEKRRQAMRLPERVRIKPAVLGFGLIPAYPMESGFSITAISADFWRKWVEQNQNFDPYVAGLIRGFDSEADARAYAREHAALKTGMEPLDQEKDPRIQTSMNQNVGDVEIDTETPRPKVA